MQRWKFWSDTNEQHFVQALRDARVDHQHDQARHVVSVEDEPWVSDLAQDLGATPCN